jgi:hypothetical protein
VWRCGQRLERGSLTGNRAPSTARRVFGSIKRCVCAPERLGRLRPARPKVGRKRPTLLPLARATRITRACWRRERHRCERSQGLTAARRRRGITLESSGGGTVSNFFGEGALETRTILKLWPGWRPRGLLSQGLPIGKKQGPPEPGLFFIGRSCQHRCMGRDVRRTAPAVTGGAHVLLVATIRRCLEEMKIRGVCRQLCRCDAE